MKLDGVYETLLSNSMAARTRACLPCSTVVAHTRLLPLLSCCHKQAARGARQQKACLEHKFVDVAAKERTVNTFQSSRKCVDGLPLALQADTRIVEFAPQSRHLVFQGVAVFA